VNTVIHTIGALIEDIGEATADLGKFAKSVPGLGGISDALTSGGTSMENFGKSTEKANVHVADLIENGKKLISNVFGALTPKLPQIPKLPPLPPSSDNISGSGTGSEAFVFKPDTTQYGDDQTIAQQKALEAQIKALAESEVQLKTNVDLATTSDQQAAAQLALRTQVVKDAQTAIGLLNTAITNEKTELATLTPERDRDLTGLKAAQAAYDAYGESLSKNPTKDQKAQLAELQVALEGAKTKYEASNKSVQELTAGLTTNNEALAAAKGKLDDVAKAAAALQLAYNNAVDAATRQTKLETDTRNLSIQGQIDYYQNLESVTTGGTQKDFQIRQEAATKIIGLQQKLQDDLLDLQQQMVNNGFQEGLYASQLADQNDFGVKSIANQRAYLQTYYNNLVDTGQQTSALGEQISKQLVDLDLQEFKDRADAHQTFVASWNSNEEKLIGDILVNHQNLRTDLQSVWNDILQDFVRMIEKMIVKSDAVKQITSVFQNAFGGLFGVGGSSNTDLSQAATKFFQTTTSGGGGPMPTLDLGASSITALTGSPTGVSLTEGGLGAVDGSTLGITLGDEGASTFSAASGAATGGYADILSSGTSGGSGTGGLLQTAGGFKSFGSALGTPISALNGATAGSVLLGVGGGALVGSLLSGITGGNQGNSTLGGAVGGGLGSIISIGGATLGPLGALGGAVIGSLAGGLFGDHTKPATSPDIYNTAQYGGTIADLMGQTITANGSSFSQESSVSAITGGTSGIGFVESVLANGKPSWMSQSDFDSFSKLFGTTTGGTLDFDQKNIGMEHIAGSNAQTSDSSYLDLGSALQKFLTEYQANGTSTTTPAFTMTRTYGDYAASVTRDSNGNYVTTVGASGGSTLATGANPSAAASGAIVSSTLGNGANSNISVDMRGATVVGTGGLTALTSLITQQMRAIDNGTAPGSYRRTLSARAGDANP
jgi:hypothetical protein